MLQPQIIQKPALTVVGLEATFISGLSPEANNFQVIGPLWDRFIHRAEEIPHREGRAMYGVMYTRLEAERAHPHEMQYIAAVAVSSVAELPAGMVSRMVPAATFAVFTHRGPITEIGNTLQIYRDWLPQSTYRHAGVADVELYDERFQHDGADSEMEYWVSVQEKGAGYQVHPSA